MVSGLELDSSGDFMVVSVDGIVRLMKGWVAVVSDGISFSLVVDNRLGTIVVGLFFPRLL